MTVLASGSFVRSDAGPASTTYAQPITIPAGSNRRLLLMCDAGRFLCDTQSTPQFNGVDMSAAGDTAPGGGSSSASAGRVKCWEMTNPPVGTANFSVTNPSNTNEGVWYYLVIDDSVGVASSAYIDAGPSGPITTATPSAGVGAGQIGFIAGTSISYSGGGALAGTTQVGTLISGFCAGYREGANPGLGTWPSNQAAALTVVVPMGAVSPSISAQPSSASVTAPATANFTATVSGTYTGLRWQRQAGGSGGWVDVSGGTGSTTTSYTTGATAVSGGSFNNGDKFRLAVDWAGGTVTSTEVTLTVSAGGTAPSISTQPTAPTVTAGSTATMSVVAAGSGTLTYQWQRQPAGGGGYSDISGANSASYTTPATTISAGSANNGDTYRCVVTGDTSPPATSNAVALTVLQPLATTFTFTLNGGNSLTGLKYAVFDEVTPDLWNAPVKKAANGSSNGSGGVTIDVTGLTSRRVGEKGSVIITNSDGTDTGGSQAATRKMAYYVGAFA